MSPANKVSGCMKFVAGTHQQQVHHEDTFDQNNLLTRGQEIAVEVDEAKAVHVELKPGQASLHHVLLFHGSEPNQSDDRRIGLAVRYIPTHLKQAVGARDWATLVRGKDATATFEPAHVPKRDLEPEALAFHKDGLGRAGARALSRHRQDRLSRVAARITRSFARNVVRVSEANTRVTRISRSLSSGRPNWARTRRLMRATGLLRFARG